ncbi:MAG: hypothetical protein LQ341_002472 [Variospora aurantia]|nr:MAG: hypothetical protein LQ341_002472 [Variospora aurantia]
MAAPSPGEAIFSTGLGQYPPRAPGVLPGRIVLRSVPEDDMEAMIASLQAKYPGQCSAIDSAVTDLVGLSKYFDDYDQQLHGARFLQVVLTQIYQRAQIRRREISGYVQQWINLNQAAFRYIDNYGLDAFTDDDVEAYGKDFLTDVLAELQLQRAEHVKARAHQRPQQASSTQFPTFAPQDQQPFENAQRIISAPVALPSALVSSGSAPSMPSATPEMPQVSLSRSLLPYPLHRANPAGSGPVEQALRSAPLPSLGGATHYSDPTDRGLDLPKYGYSDYCVAIHPPGLAVGPASYSRVPDGRPLSLPSAHTARNPAKPRAPVYIGPSNDARVLEREEVPRYRDSFGEGRMRRENTQVLSQQQPFSIPFPPVEQGDHYPAPSKFAHQGSRNISAGPNYSAKRVVSSETDYVPAAYAQGSYRKHQNMSGKAPHDRISAAYEKGRSNSAQHFTTPPRQGRDTFPGSFDAERHGYPGTMPSMYVHSTFDALPLHSPTRHRFSNASSRPFRAVPCADHTGDQHTSPSSQVHKWDRNEMYSDRKIWISGLKPDANVTVLDDLLQPWGPTNISKIKVSRMTPGKENQFNGYAFAESVPLHDPWWFAQANLRSFALPQMAADAIQALHGRLVEAYGYKLYVKAAYERSSPADHGDSPQKNNSRMYDRSAHPGLVAGNVQELKYDGTRASTASYQETLPVPSGQLALASNKREQICAESAGPGLNLLHPISESQTSNTSGVSSGIHGQGDPRGQLVAIEVAPPIHTHTGHSPTSNTPSLEKTKNGHVNKDEPTADKAQAKQRKDMLSNLRTEKFALDPYDPALITDNRQQVQDPQEADRTMLQKVLGRQEDTVEQSDNPPFMPDEPEEPSVAIYEDQSTSQASPAHGSPAHGRHLSSPSMIMPTDPTSYAQSECSQNGSRDVRSSPTRKGSPPMAAMASAHPTSSGSVDVSKLDQLLAKEVDAVLQASVADQVSIAVGQPEDRCNGIPSSSAIKTRDSCLAAMETQPQLSEIANCRADSPGVADSLHKLSEHEEDSTSQHASSSIHGLLSATSQPKLEDFSSLQAQQALTASPKRGPSKDPKLLTAIPKGLPPVRRKPQIQRTESKRDEPPKELTISVNSLEIPRRTENSTPLVEDALQGLSSMPSKVAPTICEETMVPTTTQKDKVDPNHRIIADPTAAGTGDAEARVEDNAGACEEICASDTVAPSEDNQHDPVNDTAQKLSAAVEDREEAGPVVQAMAQPAVEQKKRKNKKGKKKAKKAKASQTNSDDTNNKNPTEPIPAEKQAKTVMAPIVERPFVSDEGQDLRRPLFVQRNHSSMRRRIDAQIPMTFESRESTKSDDNTWDFPNHGTGSPLDGLGSSRHVDEATRQARVDEIDDYCLKNDKASRADLLEMLTRIAPPHPTDSHVPINLDLQVKSSQAPLKLSLCSNPDRLDNSTQQIDEHGLNNNEASGSQIFGMLGAILPEPSNEESMAEAHDKPAKKPKQDINGTRHEADYEQQDRSGQDNDETLHIEVSEMLDTIVPEPSSEKALRQGDERPKNSEVCQEEDEIPRHGLSDMFSSLAPDGSDDDSHVYDNDQAQSPPTAPLKERAQRMLPSREVSPDPASGEDVVTATAADHKVNGPENRGDFNTIKGQGAASFPSTRYTPPERGRHHSISSATGLGISSIGRASASAENISPSRLQPNGSLSYRQVAIASGAHPIQTGDIVELVHSDSDAGGKKGPGLMLRKAGNDPWQVPSAEQPWGANKSAKGKGPAESPEAHK